MKNFCAVCVSVIILTIISSCGSGSKKQVTPNSDTIPADIAKVSEMINKDPENASLYNDRAKIYIQKKDMNNALNDINKAMSLDSSKAPFYVTLSDILFAQGNITNCRKALEKCFTIDPKYVEGLMKLAELHLFFKEYKQTLDFINKATDVDKFNPKAYLMAGVTYKEMGDTISAIKSFQKSLEQDDKLIEADIQLGILFSTKHNRLAVDYLNNALKVNPSSIEAHYALGMFYQENDELNKAIEEYTTILKIDPKNKNASYNLGYIHLVYLKVYDVAVKHFTNAISSDPNYAEAYFNRGYCYELLGDVNNSLLDYKKAQEIRPGYQKALDGQKRITSFKNMK